jgi:hypothetical protein
MTKPGAKKIRRTARRAYVTMNWCCPHSAVMQTPITVRQIRITQDKSGLHLNLLQTKPKG